MNADIFSLAKQRAVKFGVKNVVVASNSGQSVERAQEVFGADFTLFAVGNAPSSREKGLALHSGILDSTKQRLEKRSIRVIRQDASMFQGSANKSSRAASFENANVAYVDRFGRTFAEDERIPDNICRVMGHVLAEFFGDGPKVCLEITLMAADSGELPLDEDCMAIARPRGYSHAALIVHPVKTTDLFSTHFRVKDLILVPSDDDIWFNDGPIP